MTVAQARDDVPDVRRGAATDERLVVLMITTAVCLTAAQFLARDARWLVTMLDRVGADALSGRVGGAMAGRHGEFWDLAHWSLVQSVCYVALPLAVVVCAWRAPIADFGLRRPTRSRVAGWYVAAYGVALPFVVIASTSSEFQGKYPFYRLGLDESFWPYLFGWWVLYAVQFAALEFFFRGYLLHGLAADLPAPVAVAVMVVPYNMIHYGKPMAEALAAVAGGAVMGVLALRTRSIWFGAALHIAIAATMDLLSLGHQGRLW